MAIMTKATRYEVSNDAFQDSKLTVDVIEHEGAVFLEVTQATGFVIASPEDVNGLAGEFRKLIRKHGANGGKDEGEQTGTAEVGAFGEQTEDAQESSISSAPADEQPGQPEVAEQAAAA